MSKAKTQAKRAADRKIGQRLGELMTARGYSQAKLGKILGLTGAAVGKIVRGESSLSSAEAAKIGNLFNVSVAYLTLQVDTPISADEQKQIETDAPFFQHVLDYVGIKTLPAYTLGFEDNCLVSYRPPRIPTDGSFIPEISIYDDEAGVPHAYNTLALDAFIKDELPTYIKTRLNQMEKHLTVTKEFMHAEVVLSNSFTEEQHVLEAEALDAVKKAGTQTPWVFFVATAADATPEPDQQ